MLTIVLVRPGATEYDLQGRIQGTLDVPLADEGRRGIERAAVELHPLGIEVLYTTACAAAKETGELLAAALEVKLKCLDKLRNLDHGLWQGLLKDQIRVKQPKVYRQWQETPEHTCPPQGEMLSAVSQRVEQALGKLLRKHKEGVIGLIAPEPLASVIASYLRGVEVGDLWKGAQSGSWELIAVGDPASAPAP